MPPISVAILVIQFVVFLIWAFLAFRWLFALRADAVAESGSAFPGPASQLRAFRGGLVEQRYVKYRVRLAVLTLILLTLSLVHYLLSPGGNP